MADSFFYEVTTRICGSLDLGEALLQTQRYLKTIMPVDELIISLFDYQRQIYRIIARANSSGGQLKDEEIILSTQAIDTIRTYDHLRARIADARKDKVLSSLFPTEHLERDCCILMPLTIRGQNVGVAVFLSYEGKPFQPRHADQLNTVIKPFCMALSNSLEHLKVQRFQKNAEQEAERLRKILEDDRAVIGIHDGLKEVFEMTRLVAPLDSPVMLMGETGTGKEIIAASIHNASRRSKKPFIRMNCGAIPDNLADSELFGHEKGSFTGAVSRRIGRFEQANGGTLLLDEVGELSLDIQVKLLRVIQEHEIQRVGGSETIPVNVRLICATHRDLQQMVAQGTFREDLFYRLNVFPITIPPLRQRQMDIPEMINFFVRRKSAEMGFRTIPEVSAEDMHLLCGYGWPGNVRELQNIVERALILRKGDCLDFASLLPQSGKKHRTLEDTQEDAIREALQKCNGRISGPNGAAKLLNINASTLRSRMKKYGIL